MLPNWACFEFLKKWVDTLCRKEKGKEGNLPVLPFLPFLPLKEVKRFRFATVSIH